MVQSEKYRLGSTVLAQVFHSHNMAYSNK